MLKHFNAIENRVDRLIFLGPDFKKDTFNHVISIFERISSKLGKGNARLTYSDQKAEIEFQFNGKNKTVSIDNQLNYITPTSSGQITTKHEADRLELLLKPYHD